MLSAEMATAIAVPLNSCLLGGLNLCWGSYGGNAFHVIQEHSGRGTPLPHILLLEDEESVRALMEHLLLGERYQVDVAGFDPREPLKVLSRRRTTPDLLAVLTAPSRG
jgi:hypothetical protein